MLTVQCEDFVTGVAFANAVLCFFGEILRPSGVPGFFMF